MRSSIVHVTTVHPRHDIRIFHKEARSLGELGADVTLVVADGLGQETGAGERIRIRDVGRPGKGRFMRAAGGNLRALRAVIGLKPSIVHFHDPELIPFGLALKLLGYKVVYDVHEDVPKQILDKHWIPSSLRRAVSSAAAAAERVAKWSFDAFVVATPGIAAAFPPARTIVVQNYPVASELATASPLPYRHRPQHVAYIGSIAVVRGAREIVEAMALIGDEPAARLDMAGLMTPPTLERELSGLAGWRAVVYRGQVDRRAIAELLGSVRAGLVTLHPTPSYIEALPVKMFEYMAAGLPVIASDFPLWRKIVSDARCGLLVDPMQPAAIAQAIKWIFDNPGEAEAMGARGKAAVAQLYNWDSEAKKLVGLYTSLLSHGTPAR